MPHLTLFGFPDTTRYLLSLLQLSSKIIQMEYYSWTQIYDPKHPLSQPSYTCIESRLCLYSYISSLFYLSTVVKLVELRPVEDWVDVSRLVSWVLRVTTIVSLELYIRCLGLAWIYTVQDDSFSLLLPIDSPNELRGRSSVLSVLGSVLYYPIEPSMGRGSVLSVLYYQIELSRGRVSVLSVFGFMFDVNLYFQKIIS